MMRKDRYGRGKGQSFIPDFFLSVIIFILVVNTLYITADRAFSKGEGYEPETLQRKGFYITDTLVKTSGYPADWNGSDVRLPGLKANDSEAIDAGKLEMMDNISDDELKHMWGIGEYMFNLTVCSNDIDHSYGWDVDHESSLIIPVQRYVVIDSGNGTLSRGRLSLVIWRPVE